MSGYAGGAHATVAVRIGGDDVPVDAGVAELVQAVNAAGIPTIRSCEDFDRGLWGAGQTAPNTSPDVRAFLGFPSSEACRRFASVAGYPFPPELTVSAMEREYASAVRASGPFAPAVRYPLGSVVYLVGGYDVHLTPEGLTIPWGVMFPASDVSHVVTRCHSWTELPA